jgi:hypothetical protein
MTIMGNLLEHFLSAGSYPASTTFDQSEKKKRAPCPLLLTSK